MDPAQVDIDLMSRVAQGEESAFPQLVERHKTRVFQLAWRFLGERTEAEDVAQEVFVKIYQVRTSWQPSAKFTTWLFAITRNTCLKILERRRPMVSLDANVRSGDETFGRQLADANMPTPAEKAFKDEEAALVRAAIDGLPAQQRMAVLLSRFEEMSYDEIALQLQTTPKAVKSMLHRAKVDLKKKLRNFLCI